MAKLISDEYRVLNAREHQAQNGYGVGGYKHLPAIMKLAESLQCTSALDYGCGQATLAKHAKRVSPLKFQNYDPSIEEYAGTPDPADIVVCTDVLEHVEPDHLGEVLEHIAALTVKAAYLEIACRPAKRVLSDGRNAHINQRPGEFWLDTVRSICGFEVLEYKARPGHSVVMVCRPEGSIWT